MNTRKLCIALCTVAFAATGFPTLELRAQTLNGSGPSIEMETDDGSGERKRQRTLDGVMEPVGLPVGGQIAITLEASSSKAGQTVRLGLLDGGEIADPSTLTVATDGKVGFSFVAGITPGLYRVLVSLGTDQYELRLYAVEID
jgi:hypothetical protein